MWSCLRNCESRWQLFTCRREAIPHNMRNCGVREAQVKALYDAHIADVNRLVDDLRSCGRGAIPYVAPTCGGVHARLLSLLRDPGPKTQEDGGSGFISIENDDPTAEALCKHLLSVRIAAHDIVLWNAYPWYINRRPKAHELDVGVDPLLRLLRVLPKLKVVMLHGLSAQDGWKRLLRDHPDVIGKYEVIPTYHTSRQAFCHPDPQVRDQRRNHLQTAFVTAARTLANSS